LLRRPDVNPAGCGRVAVHPVPHREGDRGVTVDDGRALFIGPLITPTWGEIDEARERYDRDVRRLRRWRWWFVGMFTFYTTLVGILLFELFTN
jgi:hypothetical protein